MRPLVLLVLLLVLPSVLGLGITPSELDVSYEENALETIRVKVITEHPAALSISGTLADRVELDRYTLEPGETVVEAEIRMDGSFQPGSNTFEIVAQEIGTDRTIVSSVARVATTVTVTRPVTGAFATIESFPPKENGDSVVVRVRNRGSEPLLDGTVLVAIRGFSAEIARLTGGFDRLEPGSETFVTLPIESEVEPGDYELSATVIASGESWSETQRFRYGKPSVLYRGVVLKDFVLGAVNEFVFLYENTFSSAVPFSFDALIEQSGRVLDTYEVDGELAARSQKPISAFLSTDELSPGQATVEGVLEYDGSRVLAEERIEADLDGAQVVGRVAGGESGGSGLVIFIVLALLVNSALIGFLFYKARKR